MIGRCFVLFLVVCMNSHFGGSFLFVGVLENPSHSQFRCRLSPMMRTMNRRRTEMSTSLGHDEGETDRRESATGMTHEQHLAVEAPLQNICVRAGPGSGKTRVIVNRIIHLLNVLNVNAPNIIALTFTKKASKEMKDRLVRLVDEDRLRRLTVSTLHGFCVRLLRSFYDIYAPGQPFSIYDDDDGRKVVKSILDEKFKRDNYDYDDSDEDDSGIRYSAAKVLDYISMLKRQSISRYEEISFKQAERDDDEYKNSFDTIERESLDIALSIFPAYQISLRLRNALDFDDIILKTYQLLRITKSGDSRILLRKLRQEFGPSKIDWNKNGVVGVEASDEFIASMVWKFADRIRSRYRHILVDEWQDIDGSQYELIKEMVLCFDNDKTFQDMNMQPYYSADNSGYSDTKRSIYVVGDSDQTIYSWRGANAKTMTDFQEDFPMALTFALNKNFRSDKGIVHVAKSIISSKYTKTGKKGHKEEKEENEEEEYNDIIGTEIEKELLDGSVEVINTHNDTKQADFISDMCEHLVYSNVYRPSEIAILYRKHTQALAIEMSMLTKGIPYVLLGGPNFMQRKIIKDVVAYLRILSNNQDVDALRRVINTPSRGIGVGPQKLLFTYGLNRETGNSVYDMNEDEEENGVEGVVSILDILMSLDINSSFVTSELSETARYSEKYIQRINGIRNEMTECLSTRQLKAMQKAGELFQSLRSQLYTWEGSLVDFVQYLLLEVKLLAPLDKHNQKENSTTTKRVVDEKIQKDIKQFLLLVKIFENSLNSDVDYSNILNDNHSEERNAIPSIVTKLTSFLDTAVLDIPDENITNREDVNNSDNNNLFKNERLNLMSIHASKGLEFDCVMIIGLEDGNLPSIAGSSIFVKNKKRKLNNHEKDRENHILQKQLEEERRLLYVAITRSKKKCFLVYRSKQCLGKRNIPIKPSRFLQDVPPSIPFKRHI